MHAEYSLERLPALAVLYERKALRSENDATGTIRGCDGGPLSRTGTGADSEEGIWRINPVNEKKKKGARGSRMGHIDSEADGRKCQ
jgi:hypothetical protein